MRARCGEAKEGRRCSLPAMFMLVLGAVMLAIASGASAAAASSAYVGQRLCGPPYPGAAACTAIRLEPASLTEADANASVATQDAEAAAGGTPAVTYKTPIPGYLTPQSLHAAYSLPTETSASTLQTIAVVDAFDDPTAEADLKVYDEQFGLPACTAANGCFRKIDQEGHASPLPKKNGEWASEISIDVQMAHAICQGCRVLLVEANSEQFTDLGTAVDAAVNAGATEVSNSYAGPEEPAFASFFTEYNTLYYNHPGVVVTASSGDCGYLNEDCLGGGDAANFPADAPDVVGVGGTSLTESEGKWSSTVWEEGGSGCSQIFAVPTWQSAVSNFSATGCAGHRSVSDVAAIGDPNTGVDVYDSTPERHGAPTGWGVWGGTSVSSPIIAAEFALAGGAHGASAAAATLYSHLGEDAALYDVVSGSNGSCAASSECTAAVGYDGPTGVGSPTGLEAFSIPGTPTSTSPPTISGLADEGQKLKETRGGWSGSPTSFSDQWEDCDPSGSPCSPISGATGQAYTLTAGDVGSTVRVQEIAGNASGSGPPVASAPTATVGSSIPVLAGFTPSAGITGSSVTINGTGLADVGEVDFGALVAAFKVLSPTQIEATVPNGAGAGAISVIAPEGSAKSVTDFTPTLSVTSFTPHSRAPGKTVTIQGVGFNSSSKVSFGGQAATRVKHISSKKLKATVPAGAHAGAISVTNTSAPLGTVYSAISFTP
jgi:IPT/TIG domain